MSQDTTNSQQAPHPMAADPNFLPPGEAASYSSPPPAYSTKASEAGMAGGMRPAPTQAPFSGMRPDPAHPPVGSAAYSSSANAVVIAQPGAYGLVPHNMYPDSTGAIIFSCVVSWCCCCICGIVAFAFAISSGSQPSPELALKRLLMSRYWSIAGLVSGIILWGLYVASRIAFAATA